MLAIKYIIILFYIPKVFLASSSLNLAKLVSTESLLKSTLDNYIKQKQLDIKELQRYKFTISNRFYEEEINPLSLIEKIRNLNDFSLKFISSIGNKLRDESLLKKFDGLIFPNDDDLRLSKLSLARLQYTYDLDLEDLIKGKIFGIKYEGNLTSTDCFEIGKICMEEGLFKLAENWFKISLKHSNDKEKVLIKSKLIESLNYHSNFGEAWKIINEVLNEESNNESIIISRLFLDELFKNGIKLPEYYDNSYWPQFLNLCRNSYLPKYSLNNLKCFYKTTNYFTELAPFKIEQIHYNPDIFIFYEVLSEEEISKLKGLAYNEFSRSLINKRDNSSQTNYRISQTAFLSKHKSKIISAIAQRVEDMTGLTQTYNERFQVANYGLGGLYYPHYDHLSPGDSIVKALGNRIATVLFYLNDVTYGGATAFWNLKITVNPKKGSALFWYNGHRNGSTDLGTFHGACPVLLGSKWIATQWIHEFGQEFQRPCLKANNN